jgi:hypothetical protein
LVDEGTRAVLDEGPRAALSVVYSERDCRTLETLYTIDLGRTPAGL